MPSKSFSEFKRYTVKEVEPLRSIFVAHNLKHGRNTAYSLVYGGLMLLVAAWETFCKEVSQEAISSLNKKEVSFCVLPDSTKREILKFANKGPLTKSDPLRSKLAMLPDDGWRPLLTDMVDEFITDFNTPKFHGNKGKNLKKLFGRYLNADIEKLTAKLTHEPTFVKDIDKLVSVRGDLAHKGKLKKVDKFGAEEFDEYILLFQRVCAALDYIIYSEFRTKYRFAPWKMTNKVLDFLPGV